MLVSVIVPIYNSEDYLVACLSSIINQSHSDLEILIIDDGSTDGSGKICDRYASEDNRIKVFHTSNHGVSHARNIGIKESHGDYVTFIDADDTVEADYIKAMVSVCKNNADLVVSNIKDIDYINNRQRAKRTVNTDNLCGDFRKDLCEFHELTSGPTVKLYKRDIIVSHGILFDEEMEKGEDLVFNYSFNAYVRKYAFIDEANYNYYHRENNSLSRQYRKKQAQDCIKAFEKCIELYTNNDFRNSEMMITDHAVGFLSMFLKTEDLTFAEYRRILTRLYDSITFDICLRKFSRYGWRSFLINVLFKYRLKNMLWLASRFK